MVIQALASAAAIFSPFEKGGLRGIFQDDNKNLPSPLFTKRGTIKEPEEL
jgi:hypothetical protein